MNKRWVPWLLLAPFLLIMGIFTVGLIDSIVQGLGVIPAFGLTTLTFDYFYAVLADPDIYNSIGISLYVAVAASVVSTLLAVLISHCLVTLKMTRGAVYEIIKIPMFIPWMVTGIIIINLLSGAGWLARVFHSLKISGAEHMMKYVLYHPSQLGVILAFVWACTPFICYFIITIMDNLSSTLGETAKNLGANHRQSFFYVTLPLCLPTIRNVFLIVLLSCFGGYEIPVLLGMTIPRALPVEIYYQFNHHDLRHRPYAMALNTVMLILSLLLAGIFYKCFPKGKRLKKKGAEMDEPF